MMSTGCQFYIITAKLCQIIWSDDAREKMMLQIKEATRRNTPASEWVSSSSKWMAAALFEALPLWYLSLLQAETARSQRQILDFHLTRIVPRCQLCTRRIKLWIGPQERNLRASSSSSEALAHSIHVGLLPGLFSVPEKDGSSAVIFKGGGQGIKDGKSALGLTFRSVRMRCETDGPSRLEIPGAEAWLWLHLSRTRTLSGSQTQPSTAAAGRRPRPQNAPVEARRARARNWQMVARAGG